jgi:asparagine synthase (glutamine-hydrolysing)
MCGIVGVIDTQKRYSSEQLASITLHMRDQMVHRGPDGAGLWQDDQYGVTLGHRRLSIIDLSENGKQPMASPSGRYIISFNGEIYNFPELRMQLSFGAWKSGTDTETLLVGFEQWGIEKTLSKAHGMFAFAVWDRQENTLILARDRIGEKPLYYGCVGQCFVFASDCNAIMMHPEFKKNISTDGLASFLRWNYIPAPHSIYDGIEKLPAGHWLSYKVNTHVLSKPIAYWSAEKIAVYPPANKNNNIDTLHRLLKQAVKKQMLGDVPVGAFLSGGIDSSLIVALMQEQSTTPVHTFSIGFEEQSYNEAPYASAVSKHLQTYHTEMILTAKQAQQAIQTVAAFSDEPMADATIIPTYFVSKLAKKSVTVALSGAGGDELFGGYTRYQSAPALWSKLQHIPRFMRPYLAEILRQSASVIGVRGHKLVKMSDVLNADSIDTLHHKMTSYWQETSSMIRTQATEIAWPCILRDIQEPQIRMQLLDLLHYLPGDILTITDRASMALSLEVRAPLLDVEVVEFALQSQFDVRNTKNSLKHILYEYVPRSLVDRPKAGFAVPIDAWLRGDLRDWAESLLSKTALDSHGMFHTQPISKHWIDFQSGKQHLPYHLWSILMFQSWWQSRQ